MRSFIVLSFLFLAVGFYELSGGAAFVPDERPDAVLSASGPAAVTDTVTRADPDPIAALDALPGVPERLAQPLVAVAEPVVEPVEAVVAEIPTPAADETPVLASLATPLATQVGAERLVAASALNLRAGPSTADRVLTRLSQNDRVTVLSDLGDGWALVRVASDGTEGWVASEFLTP